MYKYANIRENHKVSIVNGDGKCEHCHECIELVLAMARIECYTIINIDRIEADL